MDDWKLWQEIITGSIPLEIPEKHVPVRTVVKKKEQSLPYVKKTLDPILIKAFKKETHRFDAVLDLHGFTQEQAYSALKTFVFDAWRDQRRYTLVIVGKGNNLHRDSPDEMKRGVLRDAVPKWLTAQEFAGMVASVSPATPQHGGAGALYVLLRKQR